MAAWLGGWVGWVRWVGGWVGWMRCQWGRQRSSPPCPLLKASPSSAPPLSVVQDSELRQQNDAKAARLAEEGAATHTPLSLAGQFAQPLHKQAAVLTRKWFSLYWRNPNYSGGGGGGGGGGDNAGSKCSGARRERAWRLSTGPLHARAAGVLALESSPRPAPPTVTRV